MTIDINDITQLHFYADSAHMLNSDIKGHTGAFVTIGGGAILAKSKKQRLNSSSSCESELIGTGEYLKHVTWVRNFMLAQGYKMKPTILYQDNESTI